MKCPFLKEASVKYCEASAYRKMLPSESTSAQAERCSTAAWTACPAVSGRAFPEPAAACPFLHETQAEYCSAMAVTKFIPASNDILSHCNSDGHFYCELYLLRADPQGDRLMHHIGEPIPGTPSVDGVPVPLHLHYAPNHMWLDVAEDGSCHIGIDAFAARVFGPVDVVTFIPQRALSCPTVVLRVNGVDVPMTFPQRHQVLANVYLRTATEKLTEDPYGAGWLFQCVDPRDCERERAGQMSALLSGPDAIAWTRHETDRLNAFVHERIAKPDPQGLQLMADGGTVTDGLAAHLDRDDLIALTLHFFTPQIDWRRSS